MKIKKIERLATSLHDKSEYVILLRNLKQVLYHRLVLKKLHRVIKFNQKVLLKPYIDMNTKLWKKAKKNNFKKYFLRLMNNPVFKKLWKMWENIETLNL